jgi:hypothetical protein
MSPLSEENLTLGYRRQYRRSSPRPCENKNARRVRRNILQKLRITRTEITAGMKLDALPQLKLGCLGRGNGRAERSSCQRSPRSRRRLWPLSLPWLSLVEGTILVEEARREDWMLEVQVCGRACHFFSIESLRSVTSAGP